MIGMSELLGMMHMKHPCCWPSRCSSVCNSGLAFCRRLCTSLTLGICPFSTFCVSYELSVLRLLHFWNKVPCKWSPFYALCQLAERRVFPLLLPLQSLSLRLTCSRCDCGELALLAVYHVSWGNLMKELENFNKFLDSLHLKINVVVKTLWALNYSSQTNQMLWS